MASQPHQGEIPLLLKKPRGKARDTFEIPEHPEHGELLLQVVTDRLSTHNKVHLSEIPGKGQILTVLTVFWTMQDWFPENHHIVAYGKEIYDYLPGDRNDYPEDLHLHALVVKKLEMIPVEFIFREYLTGSLWEAYKRGEDPYGLNLPPGLQFMHHFDEPVFTPTDKSATDDPLNGSLVWQQYPLEVALAFSMFVEGQKHARSVGIELLDTKFEFGYDKDGFLCVADEFLTADSSRFTPRKDIRTGVEPSSLDKQIFRDYAEKTWCDGKKIPLAFPQSVVDKGIFGYRKMFCMLTEHPLEAFQKKYFN
ncbi:phosphoribosylaminoimidazolesuccinocarboxamide synthase [candidate division KSB1 bacterium]